MQCRHGDFQWEIPGYFSRRPATFRMLESGSDLEQMHRKVL